MKKISLDSNTYGGLKQNDETIVTAVEQAEKVFISFVVYAELLYGFKHGTRYEENIESFLGFLKKADVEVVHSSVDTIEIYSDICKELRKIGRPIPTNDIWIAAQAIETGSVLVTYDRHFDAIQALRIFNA